MSFLDFLQKTWGFMSTQSLIGYHSDIVKKNYDVSLTFAGEDRIYVNQVATHLRNHGVKVFYDEFEQTQLWGKDLHPGLERIFKDESELVVMFVSKAYKQKSWTNHERRSALSTAVRLGREYILPVRFDNTSLEGLSESVACLDANLLTPEQIGYAIQEKLGLLGITTSQAGTMLPVGTIAWRIGKSKYIGTLKDTAERVAQYSGRWHPAGTPIVYTGASYCAALFELIAHFSLPNEEAPLDLVATSIRIPSSTRIKTIYETTLPSGWQEQSGSSLSLSPSRQLLQLIGKTWVASLETCVLSVPSATLPHERNLLINPAHPEFSSLQVLSQEAVIVDSRLFSRQ